MQYVGISTYQFIPYYASAIHTHTCIFKPFEDSEPTGLNVDIAQEMQPNKMKCRVLTDGDSAALSHMSCHR